MSENASKALNQAEEDYFFENEDREEEMAAKLKLSETSNKDELDLSLQANMNASSSSNDEDMSKSVLLNKVLSNSKANHAYSSYVFLNSSFYFCVLLFNFFAFFII